MPIPKTIHIIWIGDETKRPDRWINTWSAMNPDYELRVWGNDAVRNETWLLGDRINAWLGREINGAADIIRWEILFRYGGIAFDADCACVRPLEDWLLEPNCFAAWENEILRPGLIAAGALGFVPQHALVGCILQDIITDPEPFNGMAWQKLGPQRITDTFRRLNFPNLTIYPSHYFYPRHFSGFEYSGSGPIFARQYWGSTHKGWGIENPEVTASTPPAAEADVSGHASVVADVQVPAAAEDHTGGRDEAAAQPLIQRGCDNNFYLQKLSVIDVPARLPYFRSLCSGKKVLHVGCTDFPVFDPNNNLHIQLRDVCATLDGLDTDIEGTARLATYVEGHYYNSVDTVTDAYDLLLIPETIEHVHNMREFFESLDRLDFKEVLMTAPCLIGWKDCFNYRDVRGRRPALLSNPNDYVEEIHPDHKAWFSPYTLANCVEQFTPWRIEEIMFLEGKRMTAVRCQRRGDAV